ncbi:molybdopterin cofactor-binding domain-containing protein [Salicola sp. Rm-C-2C1-2]|uniref:xanthine dehydrogenase family protein molybdopterin-binding subunit n=1 Tax=Salicola sp. Rm-C-2C1-2 TaxID=3141321 RepID=UPI0032E40C03
MSDVSRRELFRLGATGSGALVLGMVLPGCAAPRGREPSTAGAWAPNAWLEIAPDRGVVFTLDRVEMGQGTVTGITTLVAEDLDVAPENIEVVFAPVGDAYINPQYGLQVTGGSSSVRISWDRVREAGARVRAVLLASAAEVFQKPVDSLTTNDGYVLHPDGIQRLAYGELLGLAARQTMPEEVTLRRPEDYRYIGRQNQRLDARAKVTGQARFGIDVELDGMRYAVVARPPVIGARLVSFDDAKVRQLPGVIDVLAIERGVAVVAESYWQALTARDELAIEWDESDAVKVTRDSVFRQYRQAADDSAGDTERSEGNAARALAETDNVLEAEYEAPFLAHATMEPQNATAMVTANGLEVWAPTQGPDMARIAAARTSGYSPESITIHTTFLGGGFGRRLTQEYVEEVAAIASQRGEPVKLVWSREDDIQHDVFRPAMLHRFRGALSNGRISAWDHQVTGPLIFDWFARNAAPAQYPWAPQMVYSTLASMGRMTEDTFLTPKDRSAIEGAVDVPYTVPDLWVRHTHSDAGVPVSYWRSVGHSHNGFAVETFMDELAHRAGEDPVQFRLRHLADSPRHQAVLERAAEAAGWGDPLPEGRARGVALHRSFGTYVAQVVEASITDGAIRVQRVTCAADCGQMVNPDIVRMQLEGGILFGLTAALYGDVDWDDDGRLKQSNFHNYTLMRHDETPELNIVLMDNAEAPQGVGEPGTPPAIPALGNALFGVTGKRQRRTPFRADSGDA